MIIKYEEFIEKLNNRIKSGKDFYIDLLKNVINNPNRYSGIFRLTNAKTKLIQNVTQSNEIKFGDFMEDILTEYIQLIGYENLNKNIGKDEDGNDLLVDQLFLKDNTIYLVEQKIRDDHDSTKKRGQYSNFIKKVNCIRNKYPLYDIYAFMWFIDDSLQKNKRYYQQEIDNTEIDHCKLRLTYGEEFLNYLDDGDKVWQEILFYLNKRKNEQADKMIEIPDFGSSDEIYNALIELPDKDYKKLFSESNEYKRLREELFSYGDNLDKVKNNRPL